jgi:transcription termination/antitermination protein NusG
MVNEDLEERPAAAADAGADPPGGAAALAVAEHEAAAADALADAVTDEVAAERLDEAAEEAAAEAVVAHRAAEDALEQADHELALAGALHQVADQEAASGDADQAVADEVLAEELEVAAAEDVIEAAADEAIAEEALTEALVDAEAADELHEAAEEEAAEAVIHEAVAEELAAGATEVLAEAEADDEPEAPSVIRGPGDWYVVHTYSGYENKVKTNLNQRIASMQMEDKIFDVHIPMEDVMEIKGGKKQVVQRKVFPGYLLVRMIYDNDSWYVVRNTPGVTGFVSSGTGTKPTPLSQREVEKILAVKKETEKPAIRLEWEEGDVVRIVAGPFADFTGTISEINVEQSKLRVMVNIFDRETPVELAFDQVAKA